MIGIAASTQLPSQALKIPAPLGQKAPTGAYDDIGREGKEQNTADPAGMVFGLF